MNPNAEECFDIMKSWGVLKDECRTCNGDCSHCSIFLDAQKKQGDNHEQI